jgi:hypothetical protein
MVSGVISAAGMDLTSACQLGLRRAREAGAPAISHSRSNVQSGTYKSPFLKYGFRTSVTSNGADATSSFGIASSPRSPSALRRRQQRTRYPQASTQPLLKDGAAR